MKTPTKRIAYTAMLCALSVLLLYLSSILPTLRIAVIAAAGVLPAVLVIRFGIPSGFVLYAAASILALLLLPGKGAAILYIVLFGHYPMLKSLIERLNRQWIEWLLKIALFNIILTLLLFVFSSLIMDIFSLDYATPILYLAGNAAFIAFDIGFTGLIAAFLQRFKKI